MKPQSEQFVRSQGNDLAKYSMILLLRKKVAILIYYKALLNQEHMLKFKHNHYKNRNRPYIFGGGRNEKNSSILNKEKKREQR